MTQKPLKSFLLLPFLLLSGCGDYCETFVETSCQCKYPGETRRQESCQKQGETWLAASKNDSAQQDRCEKALANCDCKKYNQEEYAECGLTRVGNDDTN